MASPLKLGTDPLDYMSKDRLTVVIYWAPQKGPDALSNGHAALIIDTYEWLHAKDTLGQDGGPVQCLLDKDWYVSWVGGLVDWTPRKKQKKGGHVGEGSDFGHDMGNWGGEREPKLSDRLGYTMNWPTRWVALSGLQTQDMHDAWIAARDKKHAHWRLFDKNCATMVHTVLKAGGGDGFATAHKKQLVWWPTDLIRYAKSMTGRIHKTSGTAAAGG